MAGTAVAVGIVIGTPQPALAVHLFPLTPTLDPLGHDCAKKLSPNPGGSAGAVQVVGFNFIDGASRSTTTRVKAGQAVTWTWLADHCHSVTFAAGGPPGTAGADGFMPAGQPQLVRLNGAANSFTVTFPEPGTFPYTCVHHATVGMTGSVIVEPAPAATAQPPPADNSGGSPSGDSDDSRATLATTGSRGAAGAALIALMAAVLGLLTRRVLVAPQ